MSSGKPLDILFLGSGNAFGAEGRAFSSFLLNGRYLFDCGPTVLQQMRGAGIETNAIDAIFISHFHGDHYFGLPFVFLDAWRTGRTTDLTIVGPPGIEERTEHVFDLAFSKLAESLSFNRRYIELRDGIEAEAASLPFTAVEVDHVPDLACFSFLARPDDRSLVYSGDAKLCPSLLSLVPGADVIVLECSCSSDPVHLSPTDVAEIARHASPGAKLIVTHLDGKDHPDGFDGLIVSQDLARYTF